MNTRLYKCGGLSIRVTRVHYSEPFSVFITDVTGNELLSQLTDMHFPKNAARAALRDAAQDIKDKASKDYLGEWIIEEK